MQNKINIRIILIFFVIVILLISKFLSNELIKSFFGMFIFIYVPFQYGESIIGYIRYIFNKKNKSIIIGGREILFWLIGVSIIILISYILSLFGLFYINLLIGIIILTILPFLIFFNKFKNHIYNIKLLTIRKLDLIILLVNAILVALFFRSFSTFPLQPTWDIFSFMFRAERMLNLNQFFLFSNLYSENLFRVGFSIPSLPLLLAIASKWANSNALFISWSTPFFFIPIYSLGIYFFSFYFTKKRIVSLAASIFGTWMMESSLTFGVGWLYTAPIIMLIFPFLFIFLNDEIKDLNKNIKKMFTLSIILVLLSYTIHLFMGPLMVGIIIFHKIIERIKYNFKKIIIVLLPILIIFLTPVTKGFYLDIFNNEASRSLNIGVETKISLLFSYFTSPLIIISLLGLLTLILIRVFNKEKENKVLTIGLVSISILFIYLLPISYIYRVNMFLHLFIAFFSGLFLFMFIKLFRINKKLIMFSLFILVIIIFSSIAIPIQDYMTDWTNNKDPNSPATSFMEYDLEMASWIKNNLPNNILIVSEPSQQHLIGGLTSIESLEGGHQMSRSTQKIMKRALLTKDPNWSYTLLCKITSKEKENILILSGRVFKWSKVGYLTPIYVPFDLKQQEDKELIKGFERNSNFEFLHSIKNQIYAFKYICK